MPPDWLLPFAAGSAALAVLLTLIVLWLVARARGGQGFETLRLLAEQAVTGIRSEAETSRRDVAAVERALAAKVDAMRLEIETRLGRSSTAVEERLADIKTQIGRDQAEARVQMEQKLRELSEGNAAKLGEIQRSVNEQLHAAVEKQMQTSFARVIEQFTAIQKSMVEVQSVTAQIGDLKRVFANVKTRGGWGEVALRTLLDDVLIDGAYETNVRLDPDSAEVVEFALLMPVKSGDKPLLALDAKFPIEDYERLLAAAEVGDAEAERLARRALEVRLRGEAQKIAAKYIREPKTVDFAVMYLPTDGLYVEAARIPGLIDDISRAHRVLIVGPSLCPALLRTIQLGYVTLALEQKAGEIGQLLGATKAEMGKMDDVLAALAKQAGTFSNTIDKARTRTRVVRTKLRAIETMSAIDAEAVLQLSADDALALDDADGA